ncbi:small subunit ribosomal protein S7e [Enteropsectra breve]|nr:small subunit ribosomal protein S7e [Enteropsectra breve]
MATQIDVEQRVSKILSDKLQQAAHEEQEFAKMVSEVNVKTFTFGGNLPSATVISMPHKLLISVRANYADIIKSLTSVFPNTMILTRRSGEIEPKKCYSVKTPKESILKDILFPAQVEGRAIEVEDRAKMLHHIYLNNKQLCWNKHELSTIERILGELLNESYKVGMFGAAAN